MSGHIKKLPNGKGYEVVVEAGKDPLTKKRKRSKRVVEGNAKEARAVLEDLKKEVRYGVAIGHGLTVDAFLDKWLEVYVRPKLAAKTVYSYEQLMRLHIRPYLGTVKLEELNPLILQRHINKLTKVGRKDGREGNLSFRTVQYVHRVLHKALDSATKWQLLSRNPADAVELPSKPPKMAIEPLDEIQAAALIQAAADTPYYGPIVMALLTGLRRGEILGLRWQDIQSGFINVVQTVQFTPDKGIFIKAPKSALSAREVTISEAVVRMLENHRIRQVEQILKIDRKSVVEGKIVDIGGGRII